MNEMNALDIARRMAELGQQKEACQAYTLALTGGLEPDAELEAALYLLQFGDDYQVAYTSFINLYRQDFCQEELLAIMTEAFYAPNVKLQKSRYEKNCKLLGKYPYLFRKDYLPFDDLPIRFYPYDDKGYLPFDRREKCFGPYTDFNHPVVSRNYFRDLEKPVLATDVFSQYELEYLNDNVRKSEWVGKENHIYLHYTDWETFCAYLQVLNVRPLLEEKKIVFLMENEITQYPIDFKERFDIDYSRYPAKPISIREINRIIWHTQLSAHNGGDFFNEVFDGHPNLVTTPSVIFSNVQETLETLKQDYKKDTITLEGISCEDVDPQELIRLFGELRQLPSPTTKDFFVALCMCMCNLKYLDSASRIAPAILFQPHFYNIFYSLTSDDKGRTVLESEQYQEICNSPIFKEFKYIKTFTPMRRLTTSAASTVRFARGNDANRAGSDNPGIIPDVLADRVLNRSYMIDWQDRLFQDSVLVRFEDGKLNPKATFAALAAFLDLPFTESMTYCSLNGKKDPETLKGNDRGFSTAAIYRTYDEFMGSPERYFLEYFMRDTYEYYGYDFQYYDGATVDNDKIKDLVAHMDVLNGQIAASMREMVESQNQPSPNEEELKKRMLAEGIEQIVQQYIDSLDENRIRVAEQLMRGLHFVNKNGQPLQLMPKLQLDPALLETELYH